MEEVIKYLESELRHYGLVGNCENKIELFVRFLKMQKSADKNSICEEIYEFLENLKDGGEKSAEEITGKMEPYLRILYKYVEGAEKYRTEIKQSGDTDLFPLVMWARDYQEERLGFRTNVSDLKSLSDMEYPKKNWAYAYNARNLSSHEGKITSMFGKAMNYVVVYSTVYIMVVATWKFKDRISGLLKSYEIRGSFDRVKYLNEIISTYENDNNHKTFVVMNSIARNTDRQQGGADEKNNEGISVLEIMSTLGEDQNYCKLIGEAGIGKSRLMKHLEYMDAKNNGAKVLPIYVELKNMVDVHSEPINLIAERLGVSTEVCDKILKAYDVHLYLDGVNEMLCHDEVKSHLCRKIDRLAADYPDACILVSDRENSQLTISGDIPTYLLCKLKRDMVKKFVMANSQASVWGDVLKIIEDNSEIVDAVSTPLMLLFLIKIVEEGRYDTNIKTEKDIRKCYVEGIINREVKEKGEIRALKIQYFLASLAISDLNENDELTKYPQAAVLRTFKKCADTYGIINVDMTELLELIKQMGLLKTENADDEIYTFANKQFEEYFFEYAYDKGMVEYV